MVRSSELSPNKKSLAASLLTASASGLMRVLIVGIAAMKPPSDFHTQKAARLAPLGLAAADFEEKLTRISGPGGQHVNKVSTAVSLRHVPSGVAVTVQDTRSQSMNRQLAWTRLLDAIEQGRRDERAARRAEIEKKRRQNSKRPRGVKERILEGIKAPCFELEESSGRATGEFHLHTGLEIVAYPSRRASCPVPAKFPVMTTTNSDGAMDTHNKALKINLDNRFYGTLAEIGAGQEVVRWFFRVGGAAGTIAKSISAYDMKVSDAIYGDTERYVSRPRLQSMLDHEFQLNIERLSESRGDTTSFFAFADTVVARSYRGGNECHGWMGVKFQAHPRDEPSQIKTSTYACWTQKLLSNKKRWASSESICSTARSSCITNRKSSWRACSTD